MNSELNMLKDNMKIMSMKINQMIEIMEFQTTENSTLKTQVNGLQIDINLLK